MPIREEDLVYVRDLVYKRAAIVIEAGKEYLVEARLTPVARQLGLDDVAALVRHMKTLSPANDVHTRVVEAMTTNETTFFRDVHPFDALRNNVLPQLAASRASSRSLRIWCGASSTGQEPYSIAMIVRDTPCLAGWNVQIVATDICTPVLDRAREGLYRQLEVNRGLPAPLLVRHFEREGADFRIRPELRSMVEFRFLNLIGDWPAIPRSDIVFMRNVLIYFDVPTKRRILGRVLEGMAPDGLLFLGGAETTLNLEDRFEREPMGKAVCYRPRRSASGILPGVNFAAVRA